jgi:hypothetical protein
MHTTFRKSALVLLGSLLAANAWAASNCTLTPPKLRHKHLVAAGGFAHSKKAAHESCVRGQQARIVKQCLSVPSYAHSVESSEYFEDESTVVDFHCHSICSSFYFSSLSNKAPTVS